MSRPRHLSRLMVSPSVHVVYLFQSSLSLSQSSPEGGIGFRLALEHLFKRRSFGNDQFEEYAGSANSVSSGQDPDPLPHYVRAHAEDRKSTRLNSSHRCISYAVFCL